MPSVLIVDDEPNIRRMVSAQLRAEGYEVRDAASGADGFAAATAHLPDVALVDLMMPGGMDGLALLERLHGALPDLPVVMMSGRASLADAVRATRLGAFTFLEKPLSPESVLLAITSALELRQVRRAAQALREEAGFASPLVGDSAAMDDVRRRIATVGPTDARVLITGESGTGKELAAAALHATSARRDRPFVRVNCAAIPRDLVESEMFGHERGAFTGATERRIGRFELAHTGTLLLDEIGDLSLDAQAKLLRAIEAQEIERVGGSTPVRVDVRVLAATNRDLARAVRDGTFREDLYFRLNVIPLALPSLRERPEDIPALVQHLAQRVRQRSTVGSCAFSEDAMRLLSAYPWPGNVRELANTVERLSILFPGIAVRGEHVRSVLPDASTVDGPVREGTVTTEARDENGEPDDTPLTEALDAHERSLIEQALVVSRGNIAEAARRLHTDRRHLYRRMERLGIAIALFLAVALGLGGAPRTMHAQHAQTSPLEPRIGPIAPSTIAQALSIWNTASTTRAFGVVVFSAEDTVRGALAVRDGTLALRGVVRGALVAINSDVTLFPTARIEGPVWVLGGALRESTGDAWTTVVPADRMEWWRAQPSVRDSADASGAPVLVADTTLTEERGPRWRVRELGNWADLFVASAHTYNRVEGLAIIAGPRVRWNRAGARTTVEALGIFRTGDRLAWERENLGHRLLAEARFGEEHRHIAFGATHFDEIDAVERWQLSDAEVGLATLLFGRDYRDYWNRLGGLGFVRVAPARGASLTLSAGREQWRSRDARAPLAFFRDGRPWRANPRMLEGDATRVQLAAALDTRNRPDQPLDGWWVRADYEWGRVDISALADPAQLVLSAPTLTYGRLFVDARRYIRFTPTNSFNVRVVAGGLLHGSTLPEQRRLSVVGVDALPGTAFRAALTAPDVGSCWHAVPRSTAAPTTPAASCERIALGQAEWRSDFRIALFGTRKRTDNRRWYADAWRADGSVVFFANAGRGWRVGERDGGLSYPRHVLLPLSGFLADVGTGIDVGPVGVYVAQPVTGPAQTPRIFLRLGYRF